jgi:REP element-mobilizing transposase RayT
MNILAVSASNRVEGFMARQPRIQYDGAFYHVYDRGNRRERLFLREVDYARFEEFLLDAMRWSGVQLFDWSLIPNHFHLLIQTPNGNIAEFMQRLLTRYAMYFNWAHQKVGHVFQGRYGARVCDKEAYFMELIRYVELNAYRLKKGMLARLGEWKWSSLRYYMGSEEPPEGMTAAMKEVLSRFGAVPAQAREAMAKYLADGLRDGHWEDFYKTRTDRFFGDDAFIERVKIAIDEPIRLDPRRLLALTTPEELGAQAEACFRIAPQALARPGKERSLSRIRQAFVEIGRSCYRWPVRQLADYLKRSESAVSRMTRQRWERKRELDETTKLKAFLERLK